MGINFTVDDPADGPIYFIQVDNNNWGKQNEI